MAASAIKYSLARSKMIIDIDNQIINVLRWFSNWLATEQPPLQALSPDSTGEIRTRPKLLIVSN